MVKILWLDHHLQFGFRFNLQNKLQVTSMTILLCCCNSAVCRAAQSLCALKTSKILLIVVMSCPYFFFLAWDSDCTAISQVLYAAVIGRISGITGLACPSVDRPSVPNSKTKIVEKNQRWCESSPEQDNQFVNFQDVKTSRKWGISCINDRSQPIGITGAALIAMGLSSTKWTFN